MDREELNSRLESLHEALRFAAGCGCCGSMSRLMEYFKGDSRLMSPYFNDRIHFIQAGLDEIFSLGREYQNGHHTRQGLARWLLAVREDQQVNYYPGDDSHGS